MRFHRTALFALAFTAGTIHAQYSILDLPRESQHATVLQRIGTTDITVDYSRPSVKGRTIWGEVVPYDRIWRAGANENTTITFSSGAKVEDQDVPAGTYGLHLIPTTGTWTVVLSKDHAAWGSFFYSEKMDALRAKVTPRPGPMTEQLTYDLVDVTDHGATLVMRWEKLEVPIRIAVDVHAVVLADMDAQLQGLTAFGWEAWYEAAHYAHQEKVAPEKALAWADRSVKARPNFENQTLKAQLLQEQGHAAEADALRSSLVENANNADLNRYAYMLLNEGRKAEAVKMFELNVKRHPQDPNVHDSLGEGYLANGQKDLAIKSFKKSLSMAPPPGVKANSLKYLKQLGVDTSAWETAKK